MNPRARLESAVAAAIDLLDQIDGDADAERDHPEDDGEGEANAQPVTLHRTG